MADQEGQRLAVLEDEAPAEVLQPRDAFERAPHERGVGAVLARQEPVAGALEDRHLRDPGAISGTNCTALAPLPITPTRLPSSA